MASGEIPNSLQRMLLGERNRLVRFLAARGAGDEAEDLFQDLWQKVATLPERAVEDPLSYLFRAAENLMRDLRRAAISRDRRQSDWHGLSDTPQDDVRIAIQRSHTLLSDTAQLFDALDARSNFEPIMQSVRDLNKLDDG